MGDKDLFNAWCVSVFTERGAPVLPDDTFSAELDTEGGGCCDMCYTESPVMTITNDRTRSNVTVYSSSLW